VRGAWGSIRSAARPWQLRPAHIFLLAVAIGAFFVLESASDFSYREGLTFFFFALVGTAPPGWLIARFLLPEVKERAMRVALGGCAGFCATILVGFFLGVLGAPQLYLPVSCLLVVAVGALVVLDALKPGGFLRDRSILPRELLALDHSSIWVVLTLAILGVIVASPLFSPLVRVAPNLFLNFAYIDAFHAVGLVQVLRQGAPQYTLPDLAGSVPLLYPDFHEFWIGQLSRWSGLGVNSVYFLYAPIVSILFGTVLTYATGEALTDSRWGGYIAAALGSIIVIPNVYDSNIFFEHIDTYSELTAATLHFLDLRGRLAYGAGWALVTAVVLALALFPRFQGRRSGIGLLVVASLCVVTLIRIRSNFFVVVAPAFLLICFWLLLRYRRARYLVPFAVFGALAALIYFESTRPYYDQRNAGLALVYGPFGEYAFGFLPAMVQPIFASLPGLLRPALVILGVSVLKMTGMVYTALLLIGAVQIVRRERQLLLAEWFLLGTAATAVIGAALIVRGVTKEGGGDWGFQALLVIPRVALLLASIPLYRLLHGIAAHWKLGHENRVALALGVLVVGALVGYRGAEATLRRESYRAYPLTTEELDSYSWIRYNVPETAVIAADPNHPVNNAGETIGSTNFLSGMTERPIYLERTQTHSGTATAPRVALMEKLFDAGSVPDVQVILADARFDYLIVYPDHQPKIDLTCCMELVHHRPPLVYRRTGP
jgi:hypothetical protein